MLFMTPEEALAAAQNETMPEDVRQQATVALALYLEWHRPDFPESMKRGDREHYKQFVPETWLDSSLDQAQRRFIDAICDSITRTRGPLVGALPFVVSKAGLQDRLRAVDRFFACEYWQWDEGAKRQFVYFIEDLDPGGQAPPLLQRCVDAIRRIQSSAGVELTQLANLR